MDLIIIAVATYKRPNMLRSALESLNCLKVFHHYQAQIMVCDNDPKKSAKPIFDSMKEKLFLPSFYFSEAKRGIVPARNKLLEKASKAGASYLAFFDDDETVHPDWLAELLNAAKKFQAQAVWGKTVYFLPPNHPKWLEKRNFFGGDQPITGTQRRGASTNNVLIDMQFLNKHNIRFDQRFNDIGGSDSFLFREVRDHGGKVISSQEAITYEEVPSSRASEEWILRRAYKNAHTEFRRTLIRKGRFAAVLLASFYGVWLAVSYFFSQVLYPFKGYDFRIFNRRRRSKVKGLIHALKGRSHEEYSIIHGN
ncbi:MAG: glycosyltransferase family 2 protein [Bacteroidota bacterium]